MKICPNFNNITSITLCKTHIFTNLLTFIYPNDRNSLWMVELNIFFMKSGWKKHIVDLDYNEKFIFERKGATKIKFGDMKSIIFY